MNKTFTISFAFLLACIFYSMPTTIQARTELNNFEKHNLFQTVCATKLTKEEMEILLKDANPMTLKRLADDPELKKKQIQSLKVLFAIACQSIKEGFGEGYNVKQELANFVIEQTAAAYDREINKNPMPLFSLISEAQIKEFYAIAGNETEFEKYLSGKTKLAKENGQIKDDSEFSQEDIKQAKAHFAKTQIYYKEANRKSNELPKEFWSKLGFSIKLQKAQFLSRIYSEKILADKTKITDEDLQNHIAKQPEFDTKVQKAKGNKILQRAKSGENFARLAKQFNEDQGSKDFDGLYQNVAAGQFLPEFEQAALSLKPGQIYPRLVETNYGYHIIKLIKKGAIKDENGVMKPSYDVRHILFSTMVKDPDNPAAREMPVKDFVRSKLETEKEKKVIDEILANNPVEIAEDFEIPKVSDEQLQQMIQMQQQQMPQPQVETEVKTDNEITLPTKIKTYLNLTYRGWKLASTSDFCSTEFRRAIVSGDFDGDGKIDYTVKIVKGSKGYVLAFLARNNRYETHILHSIKASDVIDTGLSIFRKGEKYSTGDVGDENPTSITLKNDAPFDGPCASDTGGIHIYKNGRFVAY